LSRLLENQFQNYLFFVILVNVAYFGNTPGVLTVSVVEKDLSKDGSRQARTVKLFILRAKRSGVEKSWWGWFSTGSNSKEARQFIPRVKICPTPWG